MFVGLDLGTTNIKALLVDEDGRVVARSSAPVDIVHAAGGAVEQDLAEIVAATLAAMTDLGSPEQRSAVRAIGISAQGGAMQITDDAGATVGPVIGWMDGRGGPYNDALNAERPREWFIEHLGHARSNLCLGQLLRLRAQSPDVLARGNRVGFVGDLVVARLAGRAAHDATSLSIAWLYNPAIKDADPDVLALVGISADQLPEIVSARQPAGGLLDEVAAATGLPAGIPVGPAVHDQYAAAVGAGSVAAGDVMLGTGTAWVLLANTDRLAPPAGNIAFVCDHVVAGLFGQMLSMVNGGSAFAWAVRALGLAECSGEQLDEMMSAVPAGCDGLRCEPTFAAGAGAEAGGAKLTGLRLSHTPGHVLRAVAEGLACELTRHLDLLTEADLPVSRLIMTGGAAASSVTPQIVADVTRLPLVCATESAMSAFGAATIARGLIETDAGLASLAERYAPSSATTQPSKDRAVYERIYEDYIAQR